MARYPAKPGAWAVKPYGDDEAAWEVAKQQCRTLLFTWAAGWRPGTYAEVAQHVGPDQRQQECPSHEAGPAR